MRKIDPFPRRCPHVKQHAMVLMGSFFVLCRIIYGIGISSDKKDLVASPTTCVAVDERF